MPSAARTTRTRGARIGSAEREQLRAIDDGLADLQHRAGQATHRLRGPLAQILAAHTAHPASAYVAVHGDDAWAHALRALLANLRSDECALVTDLARPDSNLCALRLGEDPQAYLVRLITHGRSLLQILARPAPLKLPNLHLLLASPRLSPTQKAMALLAEIPTAAAIVSHDLFGGARPGDASTFYLRAGRHSDTGQDAVVDHRSDRYVRPPKPVADPAQLVALLNARPVLADAYAATSQMRDALRVANDPSADGADLVHAQMHLLLVSAALD